MFDILTRFSAPNHVLMLRCLLFLLPGLLIGCVAQRESPDASGDAAVETDTSRDGEMPNVAAYPYGAWDFTATEIGGDETFTGVLTLAETEGASRIAASNGLDAVLDIDEFELADANFVLSGVLRSAEGSVPVTVAGALAGDEMSAEADLAGGPSYALTAVRQQE